MHDRHSLERRLFQLIISRLDGDMLLSQAYRHAITDLVKRGIGGFILFGGELDEVSDFIAMLQHTADLPLFIASDIERGAGQQVGGATTFPCQMAVAAATEPEGREGLGMLEAMVRAVAAEAADAGINMPLIPVLDVNANPDNPIICTRAFSDDPEVVGRLGSRCIEVLEGEGLISCAKHFPGHGDTATDSHLSLPEIRKSPEDLMSTDIVPFRAAIAAGVSCIMVGHLHVAALDTRPATVSRKVIGDLLRSALGYRGLIITDAVTMGALSRIDGIPAACLDAGADVILHPDGAEETVRELLAALDAGTLSEGRIDDAYRRILAVKDRLKPAERRHADYGRHASLSAEVTERALTLVRDRHGMLPLSGQDRITLVLAGSERMCAASPLPRLIPNVTRTLHLQSGSHDIHSQPDPADDCVCIAIFTEVSAWKGTSGISEEERLRLDRFLCTTERSIVVSFGSPYVLRHFPRATVAIAAYDTTPEAQQAVARAMYGVTVFTGHLPIRLDLA